MQATIIDRGRGPEIAGTRITVYDVLDYLQLKWDPARIASFFQLTVEQVETASRYIEEHRADVESQYQEMRARSARGNPPELQAKIDATHEAFLKLVNERRAQRNGHGLK